MNRLRSIPDPPQRKSTACKLPFTQSCTTRRSSRASCRALVGHLPKDAHNGGLGQRRTGRKGIPLRRASKAVSPSRVRFRRSHGVGSSKYIVIAILGVTAAVVLVGVVTLTAYSPWRSGSSQAQLSSEECSKIESASNLSAGIVNLYYGDGNQTGPGSGLINQSPPGPSAYPNESTAVANVENGWTSVCTSNAFFAGEHRWGPANASWSGLARNSTGIYEYVITIHWQADPSQCSPSYGSCLGSTVWLVNVASGVVSGPTTTYVSPQPAE